jgi:hypothetical protein
MDTARVSLSVGAQADTTRMSQSMSLEKYVEPAPVTAGLPTSLAPFFDAGIAVPLIRNLGVGLAVSYASGRGDAEVHAEIPHPFYFDQHRSITGRVPGVNHRELSAHGDLVYMVVLTRIDLMLSGGASFFRVGQDLVSDVSHSDAYPYDTATFSGATVTHVTESRLGYNGGVDVTWKVSPMWGVGGLVRFARARVPFHIGEVDAGAATVGGFQAGLGLRFIVLRRPPRRSAPPPRRPA